MILNRKGAAMETKSVVSIALWILFLVVASIGVYFFVTKVIG